MPSCRPFHLKTQLKCLNSIGERNKAILTLYYCAKKTAVILSIVLQLRKTLRLTKIAVNNGKAEKSLIIEGFPERTKVMQFQYFLPALHTPSLSFI